MLKETKLYSDDVTRREVDWFFRDLNFDSAYYREFSDQEIMHHLTLIISAKELAKATSTPDRMKFEAHLPSGDSIYVSSARFHRFNHLYRRCFRFFKKFVLLFSLSLSLCRLID